MSALSKLKALKKSWKTTEAREGFAPLPDGDYQCRINSATIGEAKKSSRLQLAWDFTVVSGQFANRRIFKYDGLDTEDNLGWIKGSIEALELEAPDDIEELPEFLNDNVKGIGCVVTLKTKGEFQNTYIKEYLDLESIDASDSDGDGDEDEDADSDEEAAEEDAGAEEEEEEAPPPPPKKSTAKPKKPGRK